LLILVKVCPVAVIATRARINMPSQIFHMNYGNILSSTLPTEKPNKTIGRPVTPFRKVMNGILHVLRAGCQWKMLPKEFGSGSTCHRRFQEWVQSGIFKKISIRLLKEYHNKKGFKWIWQSIDSISIKSPLGGDMP
jgi:transposase